MDSGIVIARHWISNNAVRVAFEQGMITAIDPAPKNGETEWTIAPGLVDLQINGFFGVDFQSDSIDQNQLEHAVRAIHQTGCSRFMLTLITEEWQTLINRLHFLRQIRDQSHLLGHAIAGWHVEGPFLSGKAGYYGAHDQSCLIDPSPEHIHQLRAVTCNDPVILTLAPERPGAIDAIKLAVSLGMKVFLGHTDADSTTLEAAVRAGATAFTHIGNGCPPSWDRHDNIAWRVLDMTDLPVTLIPDGIHVSAPLFRIIHKIKPRKSIAYISDAMAAAGMPPGRYKLRQIHVDVGHDGAVRMPGTMQYAGSALCPIDGVRRAVSMLRCQWQHVWASYSTTPARLADLRIDLAPGNPADFCLIKPAPDGNIASFRSFVSGEEYEPHTQMT